MAVAIQSPSWWMGCVTLLPLMLAIRALRPFDAGLAGCFWGISFFSLSFLVGGAPFAGTVGSLALLCVIPALYAGLGSFMTRRTGFSPLLLGLGWVGVEFALHPLSLHHGLLAGTLGDGLIVGLVGNLAGYVLVAFIVAYVTASLLKVLGRVCVGSGATRLASGSTGSPPRVFPFELPVNLFLFIRPSRPRGPPVC